MRGLNAREGRDVNGERAGGAFSNTHKVGELGFIHPGVFFNDGLTNEGNHRVASTNREEANFEEGPEEDKVNHD